MDKPLRIPVDIEFVPAAFRTAESNNLANADLGGSPVSGQAIHLFREHHLGAGLLHNSCGIAASKAVAQQPRQDLATALGRRFIPLLLLGFSTKGIAAGPFTSATPRRFVGADGSATSQLQVLSSCLQCQNQMPDERFAAVQGASQFPAAYARPDDSPNRMRAVHIFEGVPPRLQVGDGGRWIDQG
jgi:hypothetical protein